MPKLCPEAVLALSQLSLSTPQAQVLVPQVHCALGPLRLQTSWSLY